MTLLEKFKNASVFSEYVMQTFGIFIDVYQAPDIFDRYKNTRFSYTGLLRLLKSV